MKRTVSGVVVLMVALLLGYMVWGAFGVDQNAKLGLGAPPAFGMAQRHAFDVLRGATRPVPLALQTRLRRARNQSIRAIWLNAARYVPTDSGLWVVNGRGETCIIQAHGGAVSCVPRASLFRKGVALGVVNLGPPPDRKPREFIVAGIVPNWIKAVDVQVGDKGRLITVRHNSYSVRAAVPILVKRFER